MKRIGLIIGFMTILVFLLPLSGQDAKKEVDKKDVKADDKKEPDKKDKEKKPAVEKLIYGGKFVTRIVGQKGETNREYTVQVNEVDPKKVYDMNLWSTQRQQQLAQQYAQALQQKDFNQRAQQLANYQRDTANYQIELAKRKTQVYTAKNMEIRAAENAKVRTMTPPIEFDDTGFQKKWTKKELDALREKSPLHLSMGGTAVTNAPGYPSDLDAIKQGQLVEVYMVKTAPLKKDDTKKKKGPADDDPPMVQQGNEFVLIVILPEGK